MSCPITKLVLIDLDETLVEDQWKALPEARIVLQLLSDLGYKLVLFSHNHNAIQVAIRADLYYDPRHCDCRCYWDFVAAGLAPPSGHVTSYSALTKEWNLQQVVLRYTDVTLQEMVVFDDWRRVIDWCAELQIPCRQVNPRKGITANDVVAMGLVPWHPVFGYSMNHTT